MKHKMNYSIPFILTISFLLQATAIAQSYNIPNSVVGNGGEKMSSSNYTLTGTTLPAPAALSLSSTSYRHGSGFWATIDFIAPAAPTGLTAAPGNGQVNLKWNTVNDADLAKYRIYRRTAATSLALIYSVMSSFPLDTSYIDNNVINDTTYYYQVTAVDSAGNESGYSNEDSAIPSTSITVELLVGANSTTSGNQDQGYPLNTWYHDVKHQSLYHAADLTNAGLTAGATITAVDIFPAQSPGMSMQNFRVATAWTSVSALAGFVATSVGYGPVSHYPADFPVGNWVRLPISPIIWNGNDNLVVEFSHDNDGYTAGGGIYLRQTGANSNRGRRGSSDSNAGNYPFDNNMDDNAISDNKVAYLQLTYTIPDVLPPTNLIVTPSYRQISLTWTASTSDNLSKYIIYRGLSSNALTAVDSVNAPATSYVDSLLTNGTTYWYGVKAKKQSGEYSALSALESAVPQVAPPTSLTATAGSRQVTLNWTAAIGSGIAKTFIYRGLSSASLFLVDSTSDATTISKINSGLINGTTYYFTARSSGSDGSLSVYADTVSATPDYTGPTFWVATIDSNGSNSTGDGSSTSPFSTIQYAINKAASGDTVRIKTGTYSGFGNYDIDFMQKNLVVMGHGGADSVTIDVQGSSVNRRRGFNIKYYAYSSSAKIVGLTIINGLAPGTNDDYNEQGGGILLAEAGTLQIENCVIGPGNRAVSGAGVYITNTDVTISGTTIKGNTANMTSGIFSNNVEVNGVGLFINNGSTDSVTVKNSIIRGNTATASGSQNDMFGGGFYASGENTNVYFQNTIIFNNELTRDGSPDWWSRGGAGAIYNGAQVYFTHTDILKNNAENTSFPDDGRGGALWFDNNDNSAVYFLNSILWGNSASTTNTGEQMFAGDNTPNVSMNHSDAQVAHSGDNNLNENPQFTDDNNNIFSLSVRSGLLGSGATANQGLYPGDGLILSTDILGNARPGSGGGNPDMGAYENSLSVSPVPAAPTGLTATAGDGQVDLSWTQHSENDVNGYGIYYSTSSAPSVVQDTAQGLATTSYIVSGLSNNVTYYFRITAIDSTNYESVFSDEVTAVPQFTGTTVYVDSSNTDTSPDGNPGNPYKTIMAAINATNTTNGTRVLVLPGTYYDEVDLMGKNIILQSRGGPDSTIIDAGSNRSAVSLSVNDGIFTGYTNSTKFIGFTFTNGDDQDPLIVLEGPFTPSAIPWAPVFENCRFTNTTKTYINPTPVIEITRSAPTFDGCTFRNLHVQPGVGFDGFQDILAPIAMTGSDWDTTTYNIRFENCVIAQNSTSIHPNAANNGATFKGGAIYVGFGAIPYFENTRIDSNFVDAVKQPSGGNWSASQGGGVFINFYFGTGRAIKFVNTSISYNKAKGMVAQGGGIFSQYPHLQLTNCVLVGDTVHTAWDPNNVDPPTAGGAIAYYRDPNPFGPYPNNGLPDELGLRMVNCTVADNKLIPRDLNSNWSGGGIDRGNSNDCPVLIFNSILTHNRVPGSNDYFRMNLSQFDGGIWGSDNSTINYSIIEYATEAGIFDDFVYPYDPYFTGNGDYSLSIASKAIGAGTNTFAGINAPAFDYNNNTRPNPSGSDPDLGAFEHSLSVSPYPNPPVNLVVTDENYSKVTISWTANTESDLAKYRIYYGTASPAGTLIDSISGANTKTIDSLVNETTYYFRITAVDLDGYESGYSNEVIGKPQFKGPVWIVDTENGSSNGIGSPDDPAKYIRDMIEIAVNGDTIMLMPGTYNNFRNRNLDFQYNNDIFQNGVKNLTLMSMYGPDTTIIDITNNGNFLFVGNGETFASKLIGLTLKNASGGVVQIDGSQMEIRNCRFLDNDNTGNNGGALSAWNSSEIRVWNTLFQGNYTDQRGGAISIGNTSADIKNCIFYDNSSNQEGGAISVEVNQSQLQVIHSLFLENESGFVGEAAISNYANAYVGIYNSIFWDNIDAGTNNSDLAQATVVDHCILQNGDQNPVWNLGENFSFDPQIIGPDTGNFSLSGYSGALGLGLETYYDNFLDQDVSVPIVDFLGKARPQPANTLPDIGPIEHRLWEQRRIVYYVDDNTGNDNNDGLSPANALLTIAEALNKTSIRDTIVLAAGIYNGEGNRELDMEGKTRIIRSAFGPASTIIDCENLGRAFVFDSGETDSVLIKGITIKNGLTTENGGAVFISNADPVFENVIFTDNSAPTGSGGAVYASNSLAQFINCVFWKNRASQSGAILVNGGDVKLNFCTAIGNKSSNNTGFTVQSGVMQVHNSILWYNNSIAGNVTATYSNIMGGYSGTGNFNGRPGFVNGANGDFHLADWSPMIGSADTSYFEAFDIAGIARSATTPDIGAYENALDTAGTYTAVDWYVSSSTGADSAQIGTANNPFKSVQWAVNHALESDQVIIAPGSYQGIVNNWGKGITIKGNSDSPSKIEILGQVKLNGGNTTLTNMRVYNVSANAVVVSAGSVNLSYLLIDNSVGKGITITDSSDATITNVTIYNNGYGIHENTSGTVTVTNAIIWDNTIAVSGSPTITYSDVEGDFTGTGNIDSDPLFVDAENNDFVLNISSPCIDTGDPSFTNDNDNTNVDMGAFPLVREFLSGISDGTNYTITGDGAAVISTDFTLSVGDSLTINAGAAIYFDPGVSLNIYGVLGASGNAESPIQFQSTYSDPDSAFGGVIINVSGARDENHYAYMFIEDVESGSVPLTVNGSATLDHITIAGNSNTTTSLEVNNGTVDLKYSILEGAVSGTVNDTGSFTGSTDQFVNYSTGDFSLISSAAAVDRDTTENWIDPDYTFADAGAFYHDQSSYAAATVSVLYPAVGDTIVVSPDSSSSTGEGVPVIAEVLNTIGHYKTNPQLTWLNGGPQNGNFALASTSETNLRGRIQNIFYTSTAVGDLNSVTADENSVIGTSGYFIIVPGDPDSVWVNEQTDMFMTQLDELTFTANIYDQFANTVSDGETVTWNIVPVVGGSEGFSLSSVSSITSAGVVSVTVSTDPTGNDLSVGDQVRVEAVSGTGNHQSALITIVPEDIYNLTMPPELTEAQIDLSADIAAIEIQAAMIDTFDNPLEGIEVNWEVVTGAGTGENLSAASSFTDAGGVARVTLNTSTVSDGNYTVRAWVPDGTLLSMLMGYNSDDQQDAVVSSINHNQKSGNKRAELLNSSREKTKVFLPVRIINNQVNETNTERDDISIYDLDDTTAVIHVVPGVTALVNLPPDSVDVLLGDQFQITANVIDQFGNTVADGTPITWEIVPSNNYVTIENLDAVTTNGEAKIDLLIEQNAPWDFDFAVQLTAEGITGSTGTHNIHDVTPPEPVSNLSVSPDVWTSVNDFTLSWTNPAEHAGVAGAHYSIDGSGDTYVTGEEINNLTDIALPANAASTFDIWLEDNAGNDDNGNAVSIVAKWDDTPPTAFNVNAPLGNWYNTPMLRFEWNASSDATAGLRDYIITIDGSNTYINHPDSTGTDIPDAFVAGTHTWTISAFDSAGNETVTGNPQTFFVDFTNPGISHNPVLEATVNSPMTITATFSDDDSGIEIAELYYRKGGEVQWQAPIDMSTLNTYQIASSFVTSAGVEYSVYSRDVAGNETYKPAAGYYSSSVTISSPGLSTTDIWPTGIPNGSSVSSYQLLAFPGQAAKSTPTDILVDDLGEYDNTKWRFFEYGGSGDWTKSEFANISSIEPGAGYFLIVKDPGLNINTGQTRSVESDQDYQINLSSGDWTMFGNPFDFSIPLANIYIDDSTNLVGDNDLLTYDGSWTNPSAIEPWKGYIYKSSTANQIYIKPRKSNGGLAKQINREMVFQENEWLVDIIARNGLGVDKINTVGVLINALDEYDKMDAFEPPMLPGGISLSMDHKDWAQNGDIYTKDIRTIKEDGEFWDMKVAAEDDRYNVYLNFDGITEIPETFEVFIIDVTLGVAQDLRWNKSYRYAVSDPANIHNLRFIAGTQEFVKSNNAGVELYPDRYSISQNFPNPFNPQTSILISLEQTSTVNLVIYNLLGEEIIRLADNELRPAGYHNFIWKGINRDGKRVASGVYFYTTRIRDLTGNSIMSKTNKMIMVK